MWNDNGLAVAGSNASVAKIVEAERMKSKSSLQNPLRKPGYQSSYGRNLSKGKVVNKGCFFTCCAARGHLNHKKSQKSKKNNDSSSIMSEKVGEESKHLLLD